MTRRKPLGRARPARDEDETRRVKSEGRASLTTAQAEVDALRAELPADLEEVRAVCETQELEGKVEIDADSLTVDPTIKLPVSQERIAEMLEERDLAEWRRLRTVQRDARLEELLNEIDPDCTAADPEAEALDRYVDELEAAEREHTATIEKCAAVSLRVIELEEDLERSDALVNRYQGITLAAWERTGDILSADCPAQGWADRLESLLRILIDAYKGAKP